MKLNQIQNFLITGLCLTSILFSSCSVQNENVGFHTYELTGRENFLVDFFAMNIDFGSESPYFDKLHKFNPDVFVATNLTEPIWDSANKKYFIKSSETGIVYECKLKKGTKIRTSPLMN